MRFYWRPNRWLMDAHFVSIFVVKNDRLWRMSVASARRFKFIHEVNAVLALPARVAEKISRFHHFWCSLICASRFLSSSTNCSYSPGLKSFFSFRSATRLLRVCSAARSLAAWMWGYSSKKWWNRPTENIFFLNSNVKGHSLALIHSWVISVLRILSLPLKVWSHFQRWLSNAKESTHHPPPSKILISLPFFIEMDWNLAWWLDDIDKT